MSHRGWLGIAMVAIVIYLGAYAVAYSCRSAAANLAYFVYLQHDASDRVLYVVFWPPYRIHGLVARRGPHLCDRPDQIIPTGP